MHVVKPHKVFLTFITLLVLASIVLSGVAVLRYETKTASPNLGTVRLNIQTYRAGQNQPTHPSVYTFSDKWNGYKYYMAYSPYPYGNGEEENPCIAASNDLYYWETPAGLANPIADNEETGCEELKDPHIVYREDLNRLEVWYLGRLSQSLGGDGTSLLLMRKTSDDGIHWNDYEVMCTTRYLSPSIFWDGEKYKMWAIGYDRQNTQGTFVYQESVDGHFWTEPNMCSMGDRAKNLDLWHGSVNYFDGQYHFVFVDNSDRQEVFYCSSVDGIAFNEPQIIVENGSPWKFMYRPTMVFEENGLACLYGVIDPQNRWFISMSVGKEVGALQGISNIDSSRMIPLTGDSATTFGLTYRLKELYKAVLQNLRIELFAFVVVELLLIAFKKKLRGCKRYYDVCLTVNALLTGFYLCYKIRPNNLDVVASTLIAWLLLNICMAAFVVCAEYMMAQTLNNRQKKSE